MLGNPSAIFKRTVAQEESMSSMIASLRSLPEVEFNTTDDLNSKKNRIPFARELSTLRLIISHNARMSESLVKELVAAEEVQDEVEQREQRLLLELESIRSELQASKRLVEILINQREVLDSENQRLAGLVHPIRRYPTEIFRIIFEWAVLTGEQKWCKTARNLSQVCNRWRSIAHETPSLWSHISIPETHSTANMTRMWDHVISKIRLVPPRITFKIWSKTIRSHHNDSDSEGEDGPEDALPLMVQAIDFDEWEHVGLLRFELPAALTQHLVHLGIDCDAPIDRIEVSVATSASPSIPWDIVTFLRQFPTALEVHITGASQIIANGAANFASVTTLELVEVKSSSLMSKLAQFTNLQTLKLFSVDFRGDVLNQDILLGVLRTLKVDNFEKVPWQRVQTPQLIEFFAFGVQYMHEDVVSFLSRNQTIRHVLAPVSEHQFKAFALAAPKLESLEIAYCFPGFYEWQILGLSGPPFPNLGRLVVIAYDMPNLEDFDKLVASRCHLTPVPVADPGSAVSLESISMRLLKADLRRCDWKHSSSLAQCNITHRHSPEVWDDEWVDCVFSWS